MQKVFGKILFGNLDKMIVKKNKFVYTESILTLTTYLHMSCKCFIGFYIV